MLAWQKINQLAENYHQRFCRSLKEPLDTQTTFLKKLLCSNKTTLFGKQHNFANITSIKDFQNNVPIQNYSDLEPYIDKVYTDATHSLSNQPTLLFEKTSGSSSSPKLIPYNALALEDFQHAIFPWIYNLSTEIPSIMQGTSYWSISPVTRQAKNSPSGIPIGMSNDALYFGNEAAEHIQKVLSVPAWVSQIPSINAWKYMSLRFLLCDDNLRLISIWSPTFLLQFIETLLQYDYSQRIITDIASGNISFPELIPFQQENIFKPNPERAAIVAQAISTSNDGNQTIDTKMLWPELRLISCWSSASSKVYANKLQQFFPKILIQAKGLLATEGAITLPLLNTKDNAKQDEGAILSIQSGFYEFVAKDGQVHLCNELATGETYSVLLTNNSGLYRYNIGDLVTVTAWYEKTPCLRFDGRTGLNADLCGEKLTEQFVLPHLNTIAGFTLLVPCHIPKPHYRLYVDADDFTETSIGKITEQIDSAFCKNLHYKYARKLGQLDSVKIVPCIKPISSYEKFCMEKGMEIGDIKPASLSLDNDWHTCFTLANTNEPSIPANS